MNELLVAKDLKKSFRDGQRDLHVLKGVNLVVRKGEFIAITGPSGAGKSTLLHLFAGLDKPTGGSVHFNGVDVSKLSDSELSDFRNRRTGFVFQFYCLLPEFSVLENVLLPAMVSNRTDRKRAVQLLGRVGLDKRINHRPYQLSAGEMQRTGIARALMNDPEIIFADEPTGNLDMDNSLSIMKLIRELNDEEERTFIIVTHEGSLAKEARRVLSIVDGVLIKSREIGN